MAIRSEYIEIKKEEFHIQNIVASLFPLLQTYWEEEGKGLHENAGLEFNTLAFVQMMYAGGIELFFAYDDNRPVGFILGSKFKSILCNMNQLVIDIWYAPDDEVGKSLFTALKNSLPFMKVQEVLINFGANQDDKYIDLPGKNIWRKSYVNYRE